MGDIMEHVNAKIYDYLEKIISRLEILIFVVMLLTITVELWILASV